MKENYPVFSHLFCNFHVEYPKTDGSTEILLGLEEVIKSSDIVRKRIMKKLAHSGTHFLWRDSRVTRERLLVDKYLSIVVCNSSFGLRCYRSIRHNYFSLLIISKFDIHVEMRHEYHFDSPHTYLFFHNRASLNTLYSLNLDKSRDIHLLYKYHFRQNQWNHGSFIWCKKWSKHDYSVKCILSKEP